MTEQVRCFTAKSHKNLKPRDIGLDLLDRSEIWQTYRQQGNKSACRTITMRSFHLTIFPIILSLFYSYLHLNTQFRITSRAATV